MNAHRAETAHRSALLRIIAVFAMLCLSLTTVQGAASAKDKPIVNTVKPVITGVAKAGETLTVTTGTWTPKPLSYAYYWYAGKTPFPYNSNNGVHAVVPGFAVGQRITVQVHAFLDGYSGIDAVSDPTDVIAPSVFTSVKLPGLIKGGRSIDPYRAGGNYAVQPGAWSGGFGTSTYELLADGVVVSAITRNGGTIPASLIGKKLSVRETISSAGYTSASATSEETGPVEPGLFTSVIHPRVEGPPVVGEQLRMSDDFYFDTSGAAPVPTTVTYQWLADGVPIPGAQDTTFTPTDAQANEVLSVDETVSGAGYETKTFIGDPTSPVVGANVVADRRDVHLSVAR